MTKIIPKANSRSIADFARILAAVFHQASSEGEAGVAQSALLVLQFEQQNPGSVQALENVSGDAVESYEQQKALEN